MVKVHIEEVLEVFLWGLEKISRPTMRNLIVGYEESSWEQSNRVLDRLAQEKLLSRAGRGQRATFSITPQGLRRVQRHDPPSEWDRPWDGAWRVVTFDLPEIRRKDRVQLWRALRLHKLGLLQRSVWIWPHDLTSILKKIIQAEGIPECFCGFTARELFLCSHAEVANAAWDFDEIAIRQEGYERHPSGNQTVLNKATNLRAVAAIARAERQAYEHALALDPLLPRPLWPQNYRGAAVQTRHEQFRKRLCERLSELASAE